jgi:hypothetical protein
MNKELFKNIEEIIIAVALLAGILLIALHWR